VVSHAAGLGLFVRIDMEGSAHTEATIAMTERLHARFRRAWDGAAGVSVPG